MTVKFEFTHRCEAPWRHVGTRKVSAHCYPFKVNGEYRRLCQACWKIADDQRGINHGVVGRKSS